MPSNISEAGVARHPKWCFSLLIALLLALAACGRPPMRAPTPTSETTARRASLGETFALGVGEAAFVDLPAQQGAASALQIRVTGVPSDSRCPRLVTCVQAGDAAVVVVAQLADQQPATLELHTSPQQGGPAQAYRDYLVRLVALDPLADHPGDTIDPAAYRAQLVVTR